MAPVIWDRKMRRARRGGRSLVMRRARVTCLFLCVNMLALRGIRYVSSIGVG